MLCINIYFKDIPKVTVFFYIKSQPSPKSNFLDMLLLRRTL